MLHKEVIKLKNSVDKVELELFLHIEMLNTVKMFQEIHEIF